LQNNQDKPAKTSRTEVRSMFDGIAPHYDFLNHFLSAGIDKCWRRKLIAMALRHHPKHILDVATGTGDLAIAALKLTPDQIVGIDISEAMLEIGKQKLFHKKLNQTIQLQSGDSEDIPFPDHSFDLVMVAFGVRNFENLQKGLLEMQRVLKSGGHVMILEFSKPQTFPVKQLYHFYFTRILPFLGRIISKHHNAYTYLPRTVIAFPQGKEFINILSGCGFNKISQRRLTFGIATIYEGEKSSL